MITYNGNSIYCKYPSEFTEFHRGPENKNVSLSCDKVAMINMQKTIGKQQQIEQDKWW